MIYREDQLATASSARNDGQETGTASPSSPTAAWVTNCALALSAIWPAVAMARAIGSPEFSPTIANLIVGFTALILIALAVVAVQPRERRVNLTFAAVACSGAFFPGDLLLGWKTRGACGRSPRRYSCDPPHSARHCRRPASQRRMDRLPQVDRRSDEDLRKDPRALQPSIRQGSSNISLLLPAIEAGLLPRFLPLSWPADAILSGCNEGDQRQFPIFRTDRYGFNNEDWVYLWDREKTMLVGDSFAVGQCVHQEQRYKA